MADCYIVRRGGAISSNAKVINVASVSALPAGVDADTIAIISATPAGEVYVSSSQPSGASSGDLWFYPSTSGKITYSQDGGIYVIGIIRQYNGSSWVAVPATQYKEGSGWLTTTVYLLNGSDTGTAHTGGWGCYSCYEGEAYAISSGYQIVGHNSGHQPGGIQTLNKVDLTGYSKIIFVGNVSSYQGNDDDEFAPRFGIQSAKASGYQVSSYSGLTVWNNNVAYVERTAAGSYTMTLNVSSYKGSYYVGAGTGSTMTITQIRMEV